jgi:hypothetical protein
MSLTSKFKKDINTLKQAANCELHLGIKNPKLYKKVKRYYEQTGVVFSGEPEDDYEILIDYLYEDLVLQVV